MISGSSNRGPTGPWPSKGLSGMPGVAPEHVARSRREAAQEKRARRAARNMTHPGAHSAYAVRNNGAPRPRRTSSGHGRWAPLTYIPAIADRAAAVARLAAEKGLRRVRGMSGREVRGIERGGVAADVEHHRGGAR